MEVVIERTKNERKPVTCIYYKEEGEVIGYSIGKLGEKQCTREEIRRKINEFIEEEEYKYFSFNWYYKESWLVYNVTGHREKNEDSAEECYKLRRKCKKCNRN